MLEIKNISKTYKTGTLIQKALNGVSLNLRDNEFVAILGPSGSGKTTLLNIIGGLDRYDDGDLIINHVSTKKYKDRDWDSYRNHTIGFVFQSYNLIPHQSVLANVEMALTISGISKKERTQRAKDALAKVGLVEQVHKKPNQMSGGQMQRVAIARALVNNPDILLADEPTGALDTKTSVQIMDLLKEVAKDRLVVMVSHNPELAEEYATRIVKIRDGEIIDDTDPYLVVDSAAPAVHKNLGKARMGFLTALSLSFNNLLSKKGRTILTAFAGSIGIIGIALILALSTGFQNYIDYIQEDTMSSYPLTVQYETANIFGALLSARTSSGDGSEDGVVKEQMMITDMMNSVGTNDLKSFKKWLEDNKDKYEGDLTEISYSYSVAPRIYTIDSTNSIVQLNPNTLMSSFYNDSAMSLVSSLSASTSMGTFGEYDVEKVKEKTELLAGKYPESYDELILVLSEKGKIPDILVYSLGLRDSSELKTLITQVMGGDEVTIENTPMTLTYEDLMNIELKLIDATNLYKYNSKYDTYEDMTSDDDYMKVIYNNAETLKIVGVAYNTEETSTIAGVCFSHELVQHVIDLAKQSEIVQKQLADKDVDVFSGNRFDAEEKEDSLDFNDLVTVDEDKLKDAFKINISEDDFIDLVDKDEITKTVMKGVNDSSNAVISDTVKSYSDTFNMLNNMYLQTNVATYEYLNCDSSNYLTLGDTRKTYADATFTAANYSTFAKSISKEMIKSMLMLAGITDDATVDKTYSGITMLVSNLTDKDFADLSNAVKSQFNTYYSTVENAKYGYDNQKILTEKYGTSIIKYGNSTLFYKTDASTNENSIWIDGTDHMDSKKQCEVIGAIKLNENISNDSVANNYTNTVVSRLITKSNVAAQTATAASSTAQNIILNVADLFGDDFMTIDTDAFAEAFNFDLDEDEVTRLMTSMLTNSNATYKNNLYGLGYQDVDDPTSISFYFKDFDSKEHFLTVIDEYNEFVNDEEKEIKYTDITGMLISSVQTIVNAATYVLIAFVSISLIVSSIMIAVITLISVMERTKEIGILRAMGASKKNVSSIFNAETFIIGLLSGTIGVTVSYLATFPINDLIYKLTAIDNLKSVLGLKPAIILVVISVGLTMIAGFIPSKKAAKQDPVIALRSE